MIVRMPDNRHAARGVAWIVRRAAGIVAREVVGSRRVMHRRLVAIAACGALCTLAALASEPAYGQDAESVPPSPPAAPPAPVGPPALPAPAQPAPAYPPPGSYPPPSYYPPPTYYPPPAYPVYPVAPAQPTGAETHDGAYVRLQLGVNWTGISARASGNVVDYVGTGGSFAVALGYSFTPHLVLYAEVLDAGAVKTDVSFQGTRTSTAMGTDVMGFGPGAAYYFGPNMFVATTLLWANVQLTNDNGDVVEASQTGWAVEALLGKEWWASDNWGLGVSFQAIVGQMDGRDTDLTLGVVPRWTAQSFSVLFSATYN
jgi:hypothetical protein